MAICSWTLVILSSLALLGGAQAALNCYYCNSTIEANCGSRFSPSALATCTGNTCTKGTYTTAGITYVARGCNQNVITPDQCVTSMVTRTEINACTCGENLCNSGRPFYASGSLHLSLLFASVASFLRSIRLLI